MDGGVLGVDAGSAISGYEITGIGHGIHMRLFSLSRFGLFRIGLRASLWLPQRLSKEKCIGSTLSGLGGFAMRAGEGSVPAGATKYCPDTGLIACLSSISNLARTERKQPLAGGICRPRFDV
jgi:hypothetical protein